MVPSSCSWQRSNLRYRTDIRRYTWTNQSERGFVARRFWAGCDRFSGSSIRCWSVSRVRLRGGCEWRRLGRKENVSGVNETRGTPLNRRDKLKHIIDLLFRHDRLAVNSGNVMVFFVTSDQWQSKCLLADKCLWFIARWHELHVSIRLGDVYSISSFRSFLYLSHLF